MPEELLKEEIERKVEEKKKKFHNLINTKLALKLVLMESESSEKPFLPLELMNEKNTMTTYACVSEEEYFDLITPKDVEIKPGTMYYKSNFEKIENETKKTFSTNQQPKLSEIKEADTKFGKAIIGTPQDMLIREYKKCMKCSQRNCEHEKQTKKMATMKVNGKELIGFEYENGPINYEACFIVTEKNNSYDGKKQFIIKKIIAPSNQN